MPIMKVVTVTIGIMQLIPGSRPARNRSHEAGGCLQICASATKQYNLAPANGR